MGKRAGRVPRTASQPKDRVWVTAMECVGCGESWMHVELSLVEDEPYGWPLAEPCPKCGRLGMMRKVAS